MTVTRRLVLTLVVFLPSIQTASAARAGAAAAGLLRAAKRYRAPFHPQPYERRVSFEQGPISIFRTGRGKDPLRFLWFHGAGQGTHNELVTRMAIAAHGVGLDLELISMPYLFINDPFDGPFLDVSQAEKLLKASPGKVLVGGHSNGAIPSRYLAETSGEKIAGVVTVEGVTHAMVPGIPALHFLGENSYGRQIDLGRRFKWGERLAFQFTPAEREHRGVMLREADHSARWRPRGDKDKAAAAGREETKQLSLTAAQMLKDFLAQNGIRR